MKTKYATDTLQAFRKMISRKKTPEKLWVDKGTEYGGTFKKVCKEKDIEVYSTMGETKAAFAERAIQSLKHIIYRYIDHGEKFAAIFFNIEPSQKSINWKISQRCEKKVLFYHYCITNCSRNILYQNSKLVIELEFRKMIFRSEKDTSHSLQMKFRQYLQKSLLLTTSKISKKKKLWENFMKKS